MQTLLLSLAAALTLSTAGSTARPLNPIVSSTATVDPAASTVTWKGYKVTGAHEGTIAVKSGQLQFSDAGQLQGGSFVIDMGSLAVTDLTGEYADKLRGHLVSGDFFGTDEYPEARYTITKVTPGKVGQYRVDGQLTIKDKTHAESFDANVYRVDGAYVATAQLKIDRSKYDVRYGSGSFFDDLGDKAIYDEFDLDIELVTSK